MKHRLKLLVRRLYARVLVATGLAGLVDRLMPRRLTILAGHCVDDESNRGLPADMRISAEKLAGILSALGRRHEFVTISEGWRRLSNAPRGRSMVALSMDDGYLDNRTRLLELCRRSGAPATVFLESRPLEARRVNWSHKYFWLVDRLGAARVAQRFADGAGDAKTRARVLEELATGDPDLAYRVKRVLKYEAERTDRDGTLDDMFRAAGGDEAALCERLYMSWNDARELGQAGNELGGHTVTHEVLSTLDADQQAIEVADGLRALERGLEPPIAGFAYPFGRRWDFDASSVDAVRSAGFVWAVTTHAGTNLRGADPFRLARWTLDEDTPLELLVAEACGGFELLRRVGIDLSE